MKQLYVLGLSIVSFIILSLRNVIFMDVFLKIVILVEVE